ncbi:TetR/AcrR family transcriptional regulator [Sphaerisporangium album]|uniref:TetR/AcrR family transcriptional regulator n=1 Tax=Sphaerisporangium album TaxID=509200 RepID=A0A367FEZ3_9ACTN|nr:TetR/AcrR family transcriptional regulator [Sphaerisporangium album]RCG28948.1 TetR/AcrR family transcriptional regulator [Sphaerisporangium album]
MIQPDPEDLTARARIRDAALLQFGEHGFERATIREIAKAAGVSSGLVRHHFGSKQELRDACDEFMYRTVRKLNDQARAGLIKGAFGDMTYVAAARAVLLPYQKYLARALADGTAAALFDQMADMTEEWLAMADEKRADPPAAGLKTRATVLTAMALAVPVLHQHVSRGIGADLFTPEGDREVAYALLDLYSHALMTPDDAATARAALDTVWSKPPPADRDAVIRSFEEQNDD